MAITTNRNGFKMFRISAAHYLLTVGQATNTPLHLCFQGDRVFGQNAIHDPGVNAKPDDATRKLIHHNENPMRSQCCRFAAE
jgi:hypothetical protein